MRLLSSALALHLALALGACSSGASEEGPSAQPDAAIDDADVASGDAAEAAVDTGVDSGAAETCASDAFCDGSCIDLQTDPRHCGTCANDCTALPGVSASAAQCVAGACSLTGACAADRADCSGGTTDGCETDLTQPAHCGSCTNACPVPEHGKASCTAGACGVTCDSGYHACGASCLADTSVGSCGTSCTACPTPANATASCDGTTCGFTCNAGFADCDGDATNGCEASLSATTTCGACTTSCAEPTPVCSASGATFACASGCSGATPTRCAGECVDTSTDPRFCGSCSTACPAPANGSATCASGACGFACNAGHHACGATCASNSSVATCGTRCTPCDAVANATSTCDGTSCGFTCNSGFRDCDATAANGCETAITTDPKHCGACGNACAGGAACVGGTCVAPVSCLEIHTNDPSLASGTYTIDPDGPGGAAPISVACDMTTSGGGWTRVSFEDFEATSSGWTNNTRTTCGAYGSILGGFNVLAGGTISKTYALPPITHTQARVSLDFVKIDSWDGELATVSIEGAAIYSRRFCFCAQGCAGICAGSQVCGQGSAEWTEYKEAVSGVVAHSKSTLLLTAGATLDQAPADESWGLDNVAIWIR